MPIYKVSCVLIALSLMLFVVNETLAQKQSAEYRFKAVYLFNFLQFIEWPPNTFSDPAAPLVIGIIGLDPFGDLLDQTVRGELINGHPIVVHRFTRPEDVRGCHLLFIPRSERARITSILSKIDTNTIVTVSEVNGFAEQGGDINFYVEDGKLRFEVNEQAIRNSSIKMSSRLLKLARIVKESGD